MPSLKWRTSDQTATAYESGILNSALGNEAIARGEKQNDCITELNEEFEQIFGLNSERNSIEELKQVLGQIQINGTPFAIFEQGQEPRNMKSAVAYAMLKIRQAVLYKQNVNAVDKQNHITFRRGERIERLYAGPVLENKPIPPKPLGGFQAFIARIGFPSKEKARYEREMREYKEKQKQYEDFQIQSAYHQKYETLMETGQRTSIDFESLKRERSSVMDMVKTDTANTKRHINSREYKAFLSSLTQVNTLWESNVTPENATNMVKAYAKLKVSCQSYLDSHSSSRMTELGRQREQLVRTVLEMQEKEQKALRQYLEEQNLSGKPKTIGELVGETRVIPVTAVTGETVGAQTSERQVLKEHGQKGIFTPERPHIQSRMEILVQDLDSKQNKLSDDTKKRIKALIVGADEAEQVRDVLSRCSTKQEFLKAFEDLGFKEKEEERLSPSSKRTNWEALAELMTKQEEISLMSFSKLAHESTNICSSEAIHMIDELKDSLGAVVNISIVPSDETKKAKRVVGMDFLKKAQVKSEDGELVNVVGEMESDTELENFVKRISAPCNSFAIAGNADIALDRRTHLLERNVASSVMAELLGCSDVLARSEQAVLKDASGEEKRGMFMEFASGLDAGEREVIEDAIVKDGSALLHNGHMKRQLADLQVLDIISGQTDRHLRNMMFQTDPQSETFLGIKGIDNDMAFGCSDANNRGFHGLYLGTIRAVDARTAEFIQSLNKEVLDYRLAHLLDEPEREALYSRIQTVQEWIKQDKVKKVAPEEWDDLSWQDLAIGCDSSSMSLLVDAKDPHRYQNIFYKVGRRMLPPDAVIPTPAGEIYSMAEEGKRFERKQKSKQRRAREQSLLEARVPEHSEVSIEGSSKVAGTKDKTKKHTASRSGASMGGR